MAGVAVVLVVFAGLFTIAIAAVIWLLIHTVGSFPRRQRRLRQSTGGHS